MASLETFYLKIHVDGSIRYVMFNRWSSNLKVIFPNKILWKTGNARRLACLGQSFDEKVWHFTEKNKTYTRRRLPLIIWSQPKSMHEKCRYLELFWSVFFRIGTGYWEKRSTSPYSVWMRENADQSSYEYRSVLGSEWYPDFKNCKRITHKLPW